MAAKMFGKWARGDSIGEGGQSKVYFALREGEEKPLHAIKFLKNKKRLDRFATEVTALRTVDHSCILQVVDFDLQCSEPYYVMPWIKHGDIQSARVNTWNIEEKLEFFAEVLAGMAVVHAKSIVHRDIKPQNILLGEDHKPVIADFGICYIEDGQRHTMTDEVAGARFYTAPELENGRAKDVDPRCDVYSLGKVLYWLVAGKHLPREEFRAQQSNMANLMGEPRYELINRFLDRAVDQDPDKRYQHAGDMLEAFKSLPSQFRRTVNVPGRSIDQRCIFCGTGKYEHVSIESSGTTERHTLNTVLGLHTFGSVNLRMLRCPDCRNVQLFAIDTKSPSNLWRK